MKSNNQQLQKEKIKLEPVDFPRKALFDNTSESNMATSSMTKELGKTASITILSQLRDERRETSVHLKNMNGKHYWNSIIDGKKQFGIEKMTINDLTESSLGGVT